MRTSLLFLCLSLSALGCHPSDALVQEKLNEKFSENVKLLSVNASVTGGVATLTGDCKDQTSKELADSLAKNTRGVRAVTNQIVVLAPLQPAPPENK